MGKKRSKWAKKPTRGSKEPRPSIKARRLVAEFDEAVRADELFDQEARVTDAAEVDEERRAHIGDKLDLARTMLLAHVAAVEAKARDLEGFVKYIDNALPSGVGDMRGLYNRKKREGS